MKLSPEQLIKADLREELLLKRHKVDAQTAYKAMRHMSEEVNDLIGARRRIQTVALYAPINKEMDTKFLAEMLTMRGISICLPRVVRKAAPMVFNAWDMLPLHDKDAEGIPCAMGEEVIPDVVVLPVVAYNREGYRLGYGSGYYDQTFKNLPEETYKIGVGYAFQESSSFKSESHDIPMDVIVTEKEVLKFA